ncbi:MAG: hypothetical protein ABI847_10490 [Anaerolineales bacterium]
MRGFDCFDCLISKAISMPSGGTRAGAGRPRKAEKYAGQIAALEGTIADLLPELLDLQLALARGVTVQEVDPKTGGLKVYTRPPERKAIEYLINRLAGTPTQRVEVDSDPDGALELTAAALETAAKELAAWRTLQTEQLLNSQNAPPTLPTPATPTV